MQLPAPSLDYLLRQRLLQHLLFWLGVIAYFTLGYGAPGRYLETFFRVLVFLPGHIFLTYVFFYWLIPRFLVPRKWVLFLLFGTLTYFLSLAYAYFISVHVLKLLQLESIWIGSPLIGQTTMLGAALAIKFLKKWYRQKQLTQELQQLNTLTELKLLRAQIHPHFLFNTLNNLYAHTLAKSSQAPEIVLKLADLLRFMIYESNVAYIPLTKEISLLRQYMALEQLRYGERLELSVSVRGQTEGKMIAPLLLLPLLENAFKHGTSNQLDQCWISLDLQLSEESMHFRLINSKEKEVIEKSVGGIGLQNVKKRLELLYPGQHQLHITEDSEVFIVNLQLGLQADAQKQAEPDHPHSAFAPTPHATTQLLTGG
jgi:sensor histidine kinase YesM